MLTMWGGLALAAPVTAGSWSAQLGPPSRSLAQSDAARTDNEPLLVYWMAVVAAPLGIGPALPGTLVANFDAQRQLEDSPLRDFTFLAVADPDATSALEAAVRGAGWVVSESEEDRPGGRFRDLDLALEDGRRGTLSIRGAASGASMADGRPSPSLWMHVGPADVP